VDARDKPGHDGERAARNNRALGLWVPAFAGTTRGKHLQNKKAGNRPAFSYPPLAHAAFSSPSLVSASFTFGRAATRAL